MLASTLDVGVEVVCVGAAEITLAWVLVLGMLSSRFSALLKISFTSSICKKKVRVVFPVFVSKESIS